LSTSGLSCSTEDREAHLRQLGDGQVDAAEVQGRRVSPRGPADGLDEPHHLARVRVLARDALDDLREEVVEQLREARRVEHALEVGLVVVRVGGDRAGPAPPDVDDRVGRHPVGQRLGGRGQRAQGDADADDDGNENQDEAKATAAHRCSSLRRVRAILSRTWLMIAPLGAHFKHDPRWGVRGRRSNISSAGAGADPTSLADAER
jgi:hypothetical protein